MYTLSSLDQQRQIYSRLSLYPPISSTEYPNDLLTDPLLRSAFLETVRLQSQGLSARYVTQDTLIPSQNLNFLLRKGSVVLIPGLLVHQNPEIYDCPTSFLCNRFLDKDVDEETKRASTKKDAFVRQGIVAFGGGDHLVFWVILSLLIQCTGRRFARNEVIVFAAMVLSRFEFTTPDGENIGLPENMPKNRFGRGVEGPRTSIPIVIRSKFPLENK